MTQPVPEMMRRLVDAAIPHVAFDGWSETAFRQAAADSDIPLEEAQALAARGAVDLAVAYHRMGDEEMVRQLKDADLAALRFRDRIAAAVKYRLEAADREAVRRGATLFALPQNTALGAQLVWGTADTIWSTLGDTSDDLNWYTKRATLSGVYSATLLYWLGDDSMGHRDTWEFLDRRIEEVMQIEKVKARVNEIPGMKHLMAGPNWLASRIRRPSGLPQGIPGVWPPRKGRL